MMLQLLLLLLLPPTLPASQFQSPPDLVPVPKAQSSSAVPLRAVGQLSNGCTGYLIGPCHVMTVAHCVYEPWRKVYWSGLEFHPGRNVAAGDGRDDAGRGQSAWSPLGTAAKHDLRLHPNWTADASGSKGRPAADAALIILTTPIGRRVGWFRHTAPPHVHVASSAAAAAGPGGSQQQQQQDAVAGRVAATGLHIAGYPDNKANGSMWQQCCTVLDWQLQGNLLWHDCAARGGNSGSPVWVVWPAPQPGSSAAAGDGHSGSSQASEWDRVQVLGVHSSSLKVPIDSQLGAYAQQAYATAVQRASAAARQPGGSVRGSTCLLDDGSAPQAQAGPRRAPPPPPAAPGQQSAAAAAAATMLAAPPAAQAAPGPVLPVVGRRALLAGAGGREVDTEHVLLPVAVPFTADTFKWVDSVLREFDRCPGE